MGRVARIVVLALVVALAGLVAQPAWAVPALPASMAAIGDSITRAYDVCCSYGDHPGQSWSTGYTSYDGISSHYERIRRVDPAIAGRGYNDAVSGAKMAAAPAQAAQAVNQGARYVTILLGANDLCTSSPSTMTPTETFRAQFSHAMATLMAQDQDPYVLVSSIPNIHQLWEVLHTNSLARWVWSTAKVCQSMLGATRTEAERQLVADRSGSSTGPWPRCVVLMPAAAGMAGRSTTIGSAPAKSALWTSSPQPQRPGGAGPGDLVRLLVAQNLTKYRLRGEPLLRFLAIRHERDRASRRNGGTMGVRKSVYALTAVEVEALREAYLAVMGLRDERGYQFHAGLHGLPLPIQCRHGDILFLPWHRAYLYFFELALQDRVPEVAVPWWDWTSATAHQDGLPPTHAAQAREDGRPNPLFDSEVLLPPAELELVRERLPGALTDDDPPRTRRDPDLPDELPRDRTIRSILRAPTFSDFSIRLENVHNDVHVWVGGSMSAVPVAGFDPVFWSHHAMIDRLWYLWQLAHPGFLPPTQTLDLALAPFPMTVRQTLDISLLGYEYAVQTS